jgi:hypothetical protein
MKTAVLLLGAAIPFISGGCGTRAGANIDAAVAATTDACQHTCTPDPLPPVVNCAAAEAGLEFFETPIGTFNGPTASYVYSYTDESQPIRSFEVDGEKKTWEPPTTAMARCANAGENRVLHIQGGPFLAWGGGIGMSMKDFPLGDCVGKVCVERDPAIPTFDGSSGNRTPDSIHATLNFSEWEGISFWARRGPDSQAGIRALVGDRFTDDDVAFLMFAADPSQPRYCERVRECACPDHRECLEQMMSVPIPAVCKNTTMGGTNPATGMPVVNTYCGGIAEPRVGGAIAGDSTVQCNSCDRNRCNEEWPAYPGPSDPAFVNRPCLPFTYKNGVSSSFCFDPAFGELPAEPDQQCGDHWTKTVAFTNEWQFFTVPFTSMTQQGWAKHTTKLDLNNISLVRFSWDGGWIDVYLDDVRFYRHKK